MSAVGGVPALGSSVSLPIAESDVTGLVSDLAAKAPTASPTFTGTVTLPSGLVLPSGVHIPSNAVLDGDLSANSHKITNLTNGSAAQDAAAFGQIPVAGSVGGFFEAIRRTSDASDRQSTTTLAIDDTLQWSIAANEVDFFLAFLSLDQANTTADAKFGLSLPSGCTAQWGTLASTAGGGGNLGTFLAGGTSATPAALESETGMIQAGGAAGHIGYALAGWVTNSTTAGTAGITWAQVTSDASTPFHLDKNSTLLVLRLA